MCYDLDNMGKYLTHLSWGFHLWNRENKLYLTELLLELEKSDQSETQVFVIVSVRWPVHMSSFLTLTQALAAFSSSS